MNERYAWKIGRSCCYVYINRKPTHGRLTGRKLEVIENSLIIVMITLIWGGGDGVNIMRSCWISCQFKKMIDNEEIKCRYNRKFCWLQISNYLQFLNQICIFFFYFVNFCAQKIFKHGVRWNYVVYPKLLHKSICVFLTTKN